MPRYSRLTGFRAVYLSAILVMPWLLASSLPALGQAQTAAPPPDPAFPKLFQQYTGLNGYEDLVTAADLVVGNAAAEAAEKPEATLKEMRSALEDRSVDRALQLLRGGLDKPIHSPRDPDKVDENTILPEYGEFRNLARLIAIQEYVYLADGQVPRAIDALRDGLRLGYIVQSDMLIGGLVGIAIDTIVLDRFAGHFDQMALRDCIHVTAVAREWLQQPSRMELVLAMEHHALENMLTGWQNDRERLRAIVKMMQPKDAPASELRPRRDRAERFCERRRRGHSRHARPGARDRRSGGPRAPSGGPEACVAAQAAAEIRGPRQHGCEDVQHGEPLLR